MQFHLLLKSWVSSFQELVVRSLLKSEIDIEPDEIDTFITFERYLSYNQVKLQGCCVCVTCTCTIKNIIAVKR